MAKSQALPLPAQLWTADSIDLTRHEHQGKLLNREDGVALGKQQRKIVARSRLAQLSQRPQGITAQQVYQWSNLGRLESLKPVRAKRMSVSPFAFFRGMPSLMLYDLAWESCHSGLFQQICGDCHLLNFGGFASPERNLLFGINDFDETLRAPFEWDLKRLATSLIIAANEIKQADSVGVTAVQVMLDAYRQQTIEKNVSSIVPGPANATLTWAQLLQRHVQEWKQHYTLESQAIERIRENYQHIRSQVGTLSHGEQMAILAAESRESQEVSMFFQKKRDLIWARHQQESNTSQLMG
ncbi:MAG: DUF2252 domain-containing protein [Moraxellaceae bacterium]|nr:MAG: DUF2252 domain-containing protein [Moraxellaceae bacterium]